RPRRPQRVRTASKITTNARSLLEPSLQRFLKISVTRCSSNIPPFSSPSAASERPDLDRPPCHHGPQPRRPLHYLNDHGQFCDGHCNERRRRLAVVVTVAKGYDLGYVWKNQGQRGPERSTGGYYVNAAQAGEPPGRWWGPGAAALGLAPGTVVERKPYTAVYEQIDPRTGEKLGRPRGSYTRYADHL